MKKIILAILFLQISLLIFSCKTTDKPEDRGPEEVFISGKELFEKEKYEKAKQMFDLIRLQYPASPFADDAQFYLAKIDYEQKQYVMASYNFSRLRSVYPGSEYSKESLYNSAMCFYELSPNYDRDQVYTKKAIQAFQDFEFLYPEDELSEKAAKRIVELRDKLAHKEYFTAGLYMKLRSPKASLIYYDLVIKNYDDTKYYEASYFGKIEALMMMKRYDQAIGLINLYRQNFPDGKFISNIDKLEQEIKEEY